MNLFLVRKENGELFGFMDEAEANRNALQTVGGVYYKVDASVEVVAAADKKKPAKVNPAAELEALRAEVAALKGKKGKK